MEHLGCREQSPLCGDQRCRTAARAALFLFPRCPSRPHDDSWRPRMRPLTLRRLFLQCSILVLILFVVVVIAVKFGAVPVSLYALGRDLWHVLLGQRADLSSDYVLIIKNIRLPRILLGIIVGASLSVAGTSFQALLRNPLADPYVLGVSMGASLGS